MLKLVDNWHFYHYGAFYKEARARFPLGQTGPQRGAWTFRDFQFCRLTVSPSPPRAPVSPGKRARCRERSRGHSPVCPSSRDAAATLRRPLAGAARRSHARAAHGASHGGQRPAVPAGQRGRRLPRGREPPGAREGGGGTPGTTSRPRLLRSRGAERALGRLPGAAPAELRGGGAAAAGRVVSTGPGRLFPLLPGRAALPGGSFPR